MVERRFGLPHPAQVTAKGQLLQAFPPHATVQPLPQGTPGRAKPEDVGIADLTPRFVVVGDSGGVAKPDPQLAVCHALALAGPVAFGYHVGDANYYNGNAPQWGPQFYEPNAKLQWPIVMVPGNHDGTPDPTVTDPTLTGIPTWMANFCTKTPQPPLADSELEFGRHTQTQPYCDWTLEHPAVTIVGVWTNAPSGGHLEQSQLDFIVAELQAAPTDRPLILVGHHPMLSVDAPHRGSKKMFDWYTACFETAKRCPDMILAGHVHDYQRFTWTYWGKKIPVIVIGNSGYHNLHALAGDATPGMDVLGDGSVIFEYGDAKEYGFLTLEVQAGLLHGSYTGVTPGTAPDRSDTQITPAKDVFAAA